MQRNKINLSLLSLSFHRQWRNLSQKYLREELESIFLLSILTLLCSNNTKFGTIFLIKGVVKLVSLEKLYNVPLEPPKKD